MTNIQEKSSINILDRFIKQSRAPESFQIQLFKLSGENSCWFSYIAENQLIVMSLFIWLSRSPTWHVGGMCRMSVLNLREMRSKHFLSSGLGLTWQVSRLSLTGCLLDCEHKTDHIKLTGSIKSSWTWIFTKLKIQEPVTQIQDKLGTPLKKPDCASCWAVIMDPVGTYTLSIVSCQCSGRGGASARANEMLTGCDEPWSSAGLLATCHVIESHREFSCHTGWRKRKLVNHFQTERNDLKVSYNYYLVN